MKYGSGVLTLVPTPIGNLSDMTFRGVQVLKSVDIIYAEDTRTSSVLLKHYQIDTPVKSYHKFNEKTRSAEIIEVLLSGKNVAVITDAGTPGISDPSNILTAEAIGKNIQISVLPGATALIPALCASGFNTERFYMAGFLPYKKKEKEKLLIQLKVLQVPIIFYEAPHRLEKFLNDLKIAFGNADVSIARELSKIYESYHRGKLYSILANIEDIPKKGEFVIIALPESKKVDDEEQIIKLYLDKYKEEKISEVSKQIAEEMGLGKNKVYDILISWRLSHE